MRECKYCGKVFDERGTTRVYCSLECSKIANLERSKRPEERKCAYCGETFIVKRSSSRIYCTSECKKMKNNSVKAENRKEKKKKKPPTVRDIAVEARKHGMSYGKYVAMKEMEVRC